nr:DUF2073 domain-containing protein [Candidatus Woesearchaeota archaeon]
MLTLQFIPYKEINNLTTSGKIKKILDLVKENKIVLVEGKLRSNEEAALIERTMENVTKSFKGIELCTIKAEEDYGLISKFKAGMVSLLVGNRQGFTIIGPAAIIKEIRKDPTKVQLFTVDKIRKRRR